MCIVNKIEVAFETLNYTYSEVKRLTSGTKESSPHTPVEGDLEKLSQRV